MTKKETGSGKIADLRKKAEKIAQKKVGQSHKKLEAMQPDEVRQTLHELRVHQVELEMQNEELHRTYAELDALRTRYFDLYDLAPVGYVTVSKQGLIIEANLIAATMLGVVRSSLSKPQLTRFILKEDQDIYYRHRKQLFETGEPQKCEVRMVKKDGTAFWALLDATAAQDADGAPVCRVVLSDITERKFRESERDLTTHLIVQINAPGDFRKLMSELTASLQNWSACEAVGIRMREGDDYPYYETRGFPPEFVELENKLCSYGPDGKILRDGVGNPLLECMCGNILCGRVDPSKPFFTAHGSFWSNNTTALLASTTDADRQTRTRNRCNGEGYESVALIPLRAGSQVFGLLQFNDHRPDRFTPELVAHFEEMADNLAIALSRRQIQDELTESEDKYRSLVELSPEAVVVHSAGKIVYINNSGVMIFGASEPGEVIDKPIKDFVHPDYWKIVQERVDQVQGKNKPAPLQELVFKRLSGEDINVETSGVPIIFNGVKASLTIIRDITERKQYEKVQSFLAKTSSGRQIEPFFNALARYLAESLEMDFVCIDNLEGDGLTARTVAVWCDGHFEDNVSYALKDTPCGEVVGKTICCFPASVCQFFPRDQVLQDLKAESYVGTTLFSHKGQPIGLIALIKRRPLTNRSLAEDTLKMVAIRAAGELERLTAEATLQRSESKYRSMIECSSDAIFCVDEKGQYQFVNHLFASTFGRDVEYFVGKTFWDIYPKEHADQRYEVTKRVFQTGQSESVEVEVPLPDRTLYFHATANPIKDDTGKIIMAMTHATDITARKHAEEEKQLLEERLQRAEKMESLGLLAGGVAHDLNNVLGIVVGYSELLLNGIEEKSPLKKDLTTIFDGSIKAAEIVNDLLTLARRGVVGKKVLNLNKLIRDFKKSPDWEKLLTYHPHVQIKTDLEPDLLNISGSHVHLEKTLYNLISNASEAMTKGGSITIKTINQYLDKPISGYDTIREGDYVVLSVSDTGDGISETDLKRIFEPFYTKKIMGRSGTGLGLSVVWGTVKDHQGYIDVQSEEGKGTTFSLYFLITREDIEEESLAVSMSEYLGNGQTLLIVDDVKDQRDLAARLLTSLNYKVSSVPSGEDAIKYLKDNQPDLIVLDMIMDPGMDGLDTYKSVLEINPKQKAIIVSGFSESDRVKEAKALGAGAYIKKPYIKEKLGLAVKKELDRK